MDGLAKTDQHRLLEPGPAVRPETKPFKLDPPYRVVEEVVATRSHRQTRKELDQNRTDFITRHEHTQDHVPFLGIRDPG